MKHAFSRRELVVEARDLHRQMSLRHAATMLGVSPGQIARWRDGARLTDAMALQVAVSIVARDLGMVGVFGRVDARCGMRLTAWRDVHNNVVVEAQDDESEGDGV